MPAESENTPADLCDMRMLDRGIAVAPPAARPAGHPLGSWVRIVPLSHPAWGRFWAGVVVLSATGLLLVAAGLTPRPGHLGTHEQLGLPPCGFVVMTGLPCPTCGMTTAFALAVRGCFIEAIHAQLFGFVLAVATAGAALIAGVAVVTGRRPEVNWYRLDPTRLVWWGAVLLVASWGLKMLLGLVDGTLPAR